jgi:hypothetical protein
VACALKSRQLKSNVVEGEFFAFAKVKIIAWHRLTSLITVSPSNAEENPTT